MFLDGIFFVLILCGLYSFLGELDFMIITLVKESFKESVVCYQHDQQYTFILGKVECMQREWKNENLYIEKHCVYTTYKDTNARMNIKTCRFENVKSFLTIYLKIKSGKRKKRHVMKCDNMVLSKNLIVKCIPYDR